MIRAEVFRDRKTGRVTGYRVSGHAGTGEYGQDIVCAGISALVFSITNGLTEVLKLRCRVRQADDGGLIEVHLPEGLPADARSGADALMETLVLGLKSISGEYQGAVKVLEGFETEVRKDAEDESAVLRPQEGRR